MPLGQSPDVSESRDRRMRGPLVTAGSASTPPPVAVTARVGLGEDVCVSLTFRTHSQPTSGRSGNRWGPSIPAPFVP